MPYRHGDVLSDQTEESGTRTISVRLEHRNIGRFEKEYGGVPVTDDEARAASA
ncbi:hypothetical protein HK107_15405 [Parvularcula sp. ZS-1/3]|uniref:Uncharacterized protein n=1 Tax=Parvularcula mediterranea TaxID=2732508 RepID=A0A7Y3RP72_9PROT|nr:hypothetical protein [Parvularcula mediterranea]NNU17717.1 hypothetical protein [Parvularcula mediterranea]